jgi:large subunit ribosomal protein L32
MRRSHDSLSAKTLSRDAETGELHLRHNMTPDGVFKGRQVIENEDVYDDDAEDE